MTSLSASPLRNLISSIAFVVAVVTLATLAYLAAGWSFGDAIYMVVLTIFSVGYGEVRPIDTPYLHAVTMSTMGLGCTGMIVVTGALIQVLTASHIQQLMGASRVKNDIGRLTGHIIVCGFGRIGVMLARDLAAGGAAFVVVEREEARLQEARDLGYLAWPGDATDEIVLQAAGIERARILATVLPNDAANVFITLSARSLNPDLTIIARGEAASTKTKLIQAGADKVVLPTHIGAERMAEFILFPETARFIRGSDRMRDFERVLRDLGLEVEVAVVAENTAPVGMTLADLESRVRGAFFVIQLSRHDGEVITRPPQDTRVQAGDGLVLVGRGGVAAGAIFNTAAQRLRTGRALL